MNSLARSHVPRVVAWSRVAGCLLPFREGACKGQKQASPDRDIHAGFLCGDDVTMHIFTLSLSKEYLFGLDSEGVQKGQRNTTQTPQQRKKLECRSRDFLRGVLSIKEFAVFDHTFLRRAISA